MQVPFLVLAVYQSGLLNSFPDAWLFPGYGRDRGRWKEEEVVWDSSQM
jgi:hypothetical protein